MIQLTTNQANNVAVTLLEAQTIDPAYYLFEFTHQVTGEVVLVTDQDVSPAPSRYNQFTLTLQAGSATAGFVTLQQGYHVYRVLQCSVYGLTPDSPEVVLETGFAYVNDVAAPTVPKYDTGPKDLPAWKG